MTDQVIEGPWRATRLWNSIVRSLQEGMPLKKHRRNMRTYENCFTGAEAIEWLHKHLKKNPNFDGEVTKEQAVRLLQKLLKAAVIEPVHQSMGSIMSTRTIKGTSTSPSTVATMSTSEALMAGNLFRLADPETVGLYTPKKQSGQNRPRPKIVTSDSTFTRSPLTEVQPGNGSGAPRQIFRNSFRKTKNKCKTLMLQQEQDQTEEDPGGEEDGENTANYTMKDRQSMNMSYLQSLPPNSLVVLDDNDQTWREVFVSQLRANLSEAHVKGLSINLSYIIYNMTNVSSRGVVQLASDKSNDLPRWCLSAMKCLANWPVTTLNGEDSHFPNYRGFEIDVFSVVKDYFLGLRVPLVTYDLFDIFVSAYIKAEAVGTRPPRSSLAPRRPGFGSQYAETDLDSIFTSTPSFNQAEFYTMRNDDYQFLSSNRERMARVRHTFEVMPPQSSTTSLSSTFTPSGSAWIQDPRRRNPSLTADMSATAIMRNFLPPNTCFETAFMNENPVTRIVPQKRSETLMLQRLAGQRPPLCYTPISSGGSIKSSTWDTRSIATQTSQDEDDTACAPPPRSRQPRWKRTSRFRKSIAIMETDILDSNQKGKTQSYSTSALPSNSDGPLRKGFSSVDNLLSTETEDEERSQDRKLLERFNHLYQVDNSSVRHQGRDRRSFCGRLELLSTPPHQNVVDKKRSPDNIILSKTVRKAKREQRHKREMSCDRWTTSGEDTSPTSTKSTASLHSQTYSTSQTYLTTRYRDLTVKTPYFVDPSSTQDVKMQYARAEPYYPTLARKEASALVMSEDGIRSAVDSFKLIGLLIPPANRRKLQLLLKFMRRVSTKEKLQLDSSFRPCRDVVLETFCEAILKPQDLANYDEELCKKIVLFFVEHYDSIWTPPISLRREVEERVYQSLVSKRIEAGEDPYPITFCERVPSKVYEQEKKTGAEAALADLLDHILFDAKMGLREKKKKLLKFRDAYPNIWKQRFPTPESQPEYLRGSGDQVQSKSEKERERFPSLTRLKNAMRI